jgi:anthranilate synthase component I
MHSPFDIAADLDTPVSAYMKLAPFRPRFLLESVEGAQRLGRYSFIGFGDALTVRLDRAGLHFGGRTHALDDGLLPGLRAALAAAPTLAPEAGLPFDGGLVGIAAYDIVRRFERVPGDRDDFPEGLWVAPESLLVFDHLTRRAALLHAGPRRNGSLCGASWCRRWPAACRSGGRDATTRPGPA